MNIKDELTAVVDALNASAIPYAICGGLALAIHGFPRFTKDIDLLIRDEDLAAVRSRVAPLGFDLESGWIPLAGGTVGEQRLFRIVKAEGTEHLTLDLLVVTPALASVWEARQSIDLGDRQITVVSKEGLIRMKQAAGRTQDLADIERLENGGSPGC